MDARGVRTVQDALEALSNPRRTDPRAPQPQQELKQLFGPDAYPPVAIRAGEQGRTIAVLAIGADGKVTGCSVQTSSGSAALDGRTCEIALGRLSFDPAKDRRGRPVASTYLLPVRWVLPEPVPVAPLDVARAAEFGGDTTLEFTVDAAGKLASCRTTGKAAPGAVDECANFRVGQQISAPWQRNGQPVGVRITVHTTRTVTVVP